jgi:DNA-directed RNA polymerase subunit RPC12/RpoP
MECYACKTDLIWNSDQDSDSETFLIETALRCPNCGAIVFVSWGEKQQEED